MTSISGQMILQIMRGLPGVPQGTNRADTAVDSLDLLDPSGFACDNYDMKIPTLKSSAVYADSPITDGRTLISGALGNVTETIRLQLNAGTIVQMAAMLSKLGRFKQDCNDFWDTTYQIDPVYIKHQVDGEPGPRYALLYDIDIDVSSPIDPSVANREITLSIEREFGWRPIAPGDNPKRWTAYKRNQNYTALNSGLDSTDTHLVTDTITNGNDLTTLLAFASKNYVNIPAELVDGDLPALMYCLVDPPGNSDDVFLARDTRPLQLPETINGALQLRTLCLIASSGSVSPATDTTFVNDTGASRYIVGSPSGRRTETTFATVATDATRWFVSKDVNMLRGRYMVFARARQHGGAANDCSYYIASPSLGFTGVTHNPQFIGTSGNSTAWGTDYQGIITIPNTNRAVTQVKGGNGLIISDNNLSTSRLNLIEFDLHATRLAGTTCRLCFNDIILIPIDEYVAEAVGGGGSISILFDNTGYFTHGSSEQVIENRSLATQVDGPGYIESRGMMPMLQPKTDNRLVFLVRGNTGQSLPTNTILVYVDIVPRWSGLRDA